MLPVVFLNLLTLPKAGKNVLQKYILEQTFKKYHEKPLHSPNQAWAQLLSDAWADYGHGKIRLSETFEESKFKVNYCILFLSRNFIKKKLREESFKRQPKTRLQIALQHKSKVS